MELDAGLYVPLRLSIVGKHRLNQNDSGAPWLAPIYGAGVIGNLRFSSSWGIRASEAMTNDKYYLPSDAYGDGKYVHQVNLRTAVDGSYWYGPASHFGPGIEFASTIAGWYGNHRAAARGHPLSGRSWSRVKGRIAG